MAGGYLAQVQALIAERMKENPEEMKRRLKEIEEAKKTLKLTQELIEEMNKETAEFDIQVVKDLIKRGADIKAKDTYEATVLHVASWYGDEELAKECLQAGIDVNAKDIDGRSPLYVAVQEDNIDLAKFLIDSGADVNAKGEYGFTPLHRAKSQKMRNLLREHGATI